MTPEVVMETTDVHAHPLPKQHIFSHFILEAPKILVCLFAIWNQKWCLKEQFFEGSLRHIYRYFKNYLRKWFFKEPWFERFFVEPEKKH